MYVNSNGERTRLVTFADVNGIRTIWRMNNMTVGYFGEWNKTYTNYTWTILYVKYKSFFIIIF